MRILHTESDPVGRVAASSAGGKASVASRLATVVKWAITIALLSLLLLVVDLGAVARVLRSADPVFLTIALGLALGDRLLMAGKWLPLLRIQFPTVGAARAVRAYFASSFAALFLPASVGGDVLRAVGLGRDRHAVMEAGASVVFERILGLVGSAIVALLSLWVAVRESIPIGFLIPWALGCAGVGIGAAVIPFSRAAQRVVGRLVRYLPTRRWTQLIARFGTAYGVYRVHPGTLLAVGALSVLEQLVPVTVFWAGAEALDLSVSIQALLVAVPLTVFAARLPISIAGIGIVEGGMIYLLGLFGVPPHHALSLALVGRAVEVVTLLPGALWWRELAGHSVGSRSASSSVSSAAHPGPGKHMVS